jgi:hypothetical protein
VTLGLPVAVGVYVIEQLAELAPAWTSEQLPPALNRPPALELNASAPVGTALPAVSDKVPVHVVVPATGSDVGAQATVVDVARVDTVIDVAPELEAHPGAPGVVP